MGKHGCGEMNDKLNGERLADMCGLNNLVIGETLFPHKDIHKKTWISPIGRDQNQIDHIIINGRWRHSLENVVVKRGADVGSDHHLLLAKVKLHLKKAEKLKDGTKLRFNITKLKDPSISKEFTTLLKNRFQVLGDTCIGEGIEEHLCKNIWESTKNVYTDVSITVLGVKKKQVKK